MSNKKNNRIYIIGYLDFNKYVEIPVYVKVFQKRNGDLAYSFCVQQKLANLLRKVWALPLDSEHELHFARPAVNIFDPDFQCLFVFAPTLLSDKPVRLSGLEKLIT